MGGVLEPSRWPAPAVAAFLFRQGGAGVEEIGRRPSAGGLILGPAAGTAWDAVREGALAVLRPPGCSSHDEEGEGTEEGEGGEGRARSSAPSTGIRRPAPGA